MKILLVDDDPVSRLIVRQHLLNSGKQFQLEEVYNGSEALLKLATGYLPNLVLLDLNMPVMNGFTFLQALNEKQINLPVVMITSSNHNEDKAQAKKYSSVVGYIQKPFKSEHITKLLTLSE